MWASRNCNAVKKCSLFSVWILTVRPRAGGLWAYGFAVIHFCKNFFPRGAQAGADERGFRDVALSVAPSAGPKGSLSTMDMKMLWATFGWLLNGPIGVS